MDENDYAWFPNHIKYERKRERKSEWLNKWEKKWIVYVIVFKYVKMLKRVQQKETGAECDWKIELRWKENV